MFDRKVKNIESSKTISGFSMFTIILAIVAYFVYGKSIDASLAIIILSYISGLIALLGFIPVIGVIGTYVLWNILFSKIMILTGITATWITTVIFSIMILASILFTFISTAIILNKGFHIKEINFTDREVIIFVLGISVILILKYIGII